MLFCHIHHQLNPSLVSPLSPLETWLAQQLSQRCYLIRDDNEADSTLVTKYVEEKEEGISISPEKEVQEKVAGEEQFTEELNEVARVEFKETEEESWLNVSPGKVGRSTESKPSSETVISPSRFQLLEDVEDEQMSSRNKDIQTYISKDPNHPTEEVEEGEISGNETRASDCYALSLDVRGG
ncbi:hypothetical protein YC2023_033689 [Brassica napus]